MADSAAQRFVARSQELEQIRPVFAKPTPDGKLVAIAALIAIPTDNGMVPGFTITREGQTLDEALFRELTAWGLGLLEARPETELG